MTTPALSRRIKQTVHAPVHAWFAPCSPGLEPVLARELAQLEASEIVPVPGGVEFKGKLELGYRANLWLRTANRVLLRVAEFRSRAPEELFRHTKDVRWETLLPSMPLRVEVTLHGSRMTSDTQVERTLRDAIRDRLDEQDLPRVREALPDVPSQLLLVRLEENRVTLSLDTSGELLHKRGYREATAKAPIRETLAAGILLAAGYDGSAPLLDPMCGAGTFPIEAALIARNLPPGLNRTFRFEEWPSFKEATWRHLKTKALEQSLPQAPHPIFAQDMYGGPIDATRENAQRAGVLDDLTVKAADFFTAPVPEGPPGWLVVNPPYGVRIGNQDDAGRLYGRIGSKLRAAYPGWRFAVVVPEPSFYGALQLPEETRLFLPHGGLKIGVTIGRLPD
jgi:putative N6-adenine-specific DNA methylase